MCIIVLQFSCNFIARNGKWRDHRWTPALRLQLPLTSALSDTAAGSQSVVLRAARAARSECPARAFHAQPQHGGSGGGAEDHRGGLGPTRLSRTLWHAPAALRNSRPYFWGPSGRARQCRVQGAAGGYRRIGVWRGGRVCAWRRGGAHFAAWASRSRLLERDFIPVFFPRLNNKRESLFGLWLRCGGFG